MSSPPLVDARRAESRPTPVVLGIAAGHSQRGSVARITSRSVVSQPVNVMSMIALPISSRSAPAQSRFARVSGAWAFYLQVSIVVALLAGSAAPTPLYAVYQAAWGF